MSLFGTGVARDPSTDLPEFIFGALSTEAGRIRQARLERAGLVHPVQQVVLAPEPGEEITIRARVGAELAVAAMELRYRIVSARDPWWVQHTGSAPDPTATAPGGQGEVVVPMARSHLDWDTWTWGHREEWSAPIPGQPAGSAVFYTIHATSVTGAPLACPHLDPHQLPALEGVKAPRPHTYALVVGRRPVPAWIREAVIYQVFVDRFAPDPGQAFRSADDLAECLGGTLRGLISRLDYLQALGVTCLWLTPIFPSPSHHGYDPIDPGAVEPRLGSLADWDALVAGARARGMRLLLDYVVNHVSNAHPRFVAAQADRDNPAAAWFRFREHPHAYDCFFDVPSQPELETDHPEVRAYFLRHARFWLERGCDGFRLDYAAHVSHAFWSLFREGTRRGHGEAVTLGEITQPPDVMRSYIGRMDGCLDFRLLELLRAFFAQRRLPASAFAHRLQQHLDYFGADLVLPSFLDNHDMNRFLWLVDGDQRRLRLAALCQFTLPQPPILYYGTEVGLSQRAGVGRLEEARLPMLWEGEQDRELLAYFQALIAFRQAHPCLRLEPRHTWLLEDGQGLLGVRCGPLALLFNNGDQAASVTMPQEWGPVDLALLTAPLERFAPAMGQLRLAPWGGAVLRIRRGSPSPLAAGPPAPSPGHRDGG
ncbi:MAG: alpha-amylase family glycosyl hydrolase [Cyanobacteriota bacterium]|nr:alpha-amylase family glycosyl hydrolase [Cyanobacteriota bacterium]